MSTAPDNLFMMNEDYKKLSNEAAAAFHTIAERLFTSPKELGWISAWQLHS
jgi:hypothetical protein